MNESSFHFPGSIRCDGRTWHLLYDPGNPNTTLPDLSGAQVTALACSPVAIGKQSGTQQVYMVTVDLKIPARAGLGSVSAPKTVRGFRIYPAPVNPERTPPQEMAMYLEEQMPAQGNAAQAFLDAILGVSLAEQPRPNTNWAQEVLAPAASAGPDEKEMKDAPA